MLRLFLELVPALLVGFVTGVRAPQALDWLPGHLVTYGVPLSITALLLRAGLRWDLLGAGGMALLAISLSLCLLQWVEPLQRRVRGGALRLSCVVGNTAYFGVPAALALLPPEAIGFTVTYDIVATLLIWTIGEPLIANSGLKAMGMLQALGMSPACRGLVTALLLGLTPWQAMLGRFLWWPARLVILLALVVVGMRLGEMTLRPSSDRLVRRALGAPLLVKLVLFPLLLLMLSMALALPPLLRNAVVLQGAAPTAISVLLLAESAGTGIDEAAEMVFWSTAFALFTVPLWGWLLAGPLVGWPIPWD